MLRCPDPLKPYETKHEVEHDSDIDQLAEDVPLWDLDASVADVRQDVRYVAEAYRNAVSEKSQVESIAFCKRSRRKGTYETNIAARKTKARLIGIH